MSVEVKMKNRGLIMSLCSLLDRNDDDLLIIIITFLKKMSIYMENKDEIVSAATQCLSQARSFHFPPKLEQFRVILEA